MLGSAESPEEESFSDGLLEYPQYTRPRELNGMEVPDVLLSGDHAKIKAWRRIESLRATKRHRPDLLASAELTDKEKRLLEELRCFCGNSWSSLCRWCCAGFACSSCRCWRGFGLWSDLLQGLILGALLALLLPLSGASRRKEPFATLLVVPMIVLIVLLALQLHARTRRGAAVPARERLHNDD